MDATEVVLMRELTGRVSPGFGVAGPNLAHVETLIAQRMGLERVVRGTLNLRLLSEYYVRPDGAVSAIEYSRSEVVLLQRCVVRGFRTVIMRPHTHEVDRSYGHGPTGLELMGGVHLRSHLALKDGDLVTVEVEGDDEWWRAARDAT